MQGAAHIMMTLDIAINFEMKLTKFYGRCPDLIGKYQMSKKDMMDDSFLD